MKIICSDDHRTECPVEEELDVLRSTAAHVMAQAVKRLYPEAQLARGTATENGFRYDFDFGDISLTEEDLPDIEKEMQKIVQENQPLRVFQKPGNESLTLMKERGESYKAELIGDLSDGAEISLCQQGNYIDLCVGPHLTETEVLKAFKLTSLSNTSWKNSPKNRTLTRLNGVAFRSHAELREYEKLTEKADSSKKDHFSFPFIISFLVFTFLYATVIYISAISYYFQPWTANTQPELPANYAPSFYNFTFFFAFLIYLFGISFLFWMMRRDIKPEKS